MDKKAEAGIGSLILFIALVLVAASAAAVFIQTSESLQGKALTTASNSQKSVSNKVFILSAWGENASLTNTFADVYFKIKLAPGSDAIVLNASYVLLATDSARTTYKFNQSSGCSAANLSVAINAAKFLITPQIGYAKAGYLQDGDILNVCAHLSSNITGDSSLTFGFTPQYGTASLYKVTTPSVMTDAKIPLYP